jgi:hypothetical protein
MGGPLLMVFMIDALGHRIVRETGCFAALQAPDGPIPAVCGYSSACIPSLLTGTLPAQHGHWAMYLRDPDASVFKPYGPLIWLTSGILGRNMFTRRLIARGLRRSGIEGYFSLYEVPPRLLAQFDLCEKRDIYTPGAFPGLRTPFDAAGQLALPHRVWSWKSPEDRNRAEFAAAIGQARYGMLFFYSAGLDAVMHEHGTRSAETRSCLEDFERFIQEMLQLGLRAHSEVRLLVFGDHGMADTLGSYDLLSRIEALDLSVPKDFLFFLDSTMARFWFFAPGARERVEDLLAGVDCGRILDDEECERLGILFPDRRYGELLFLADPGWLFVPSFMGRRPLAAMHGYHPEDEDSDTILLANFSHAPVGSIRDIGPFLITELEALAAGGV